MMQVHRDLEKLPLFTNAVVTIGSFDGVHLGHQQILRQLQNEAAAINGESVIITFHPHPRKVVSSVPGDIKLLNTLDERIRLLAQSGIDHLVIVPFNQTFANQSAESYITDFLYKYFKPHTIIIGYDHRFGKGRSGDYHLLEKKGIELDFEVKEISEELLQDVIVSSTKIRKALLENDIATANAFLGYPYFFEGTVIKGNQLGRTIGYPTANLHIGSEEKLIPSDGVYTVTVQQTNKPTTLLKGMMNIGLRPTVDGAQRMIEVNIFDFDADIYGEVLQVEMIAYIRSEVRFNGLDALKDQLKMDAQTAKQLLQ